VAFGSRTLPVAHQGERGVRDEPNKHHVSEVRLGREGDPGRPPCHPGQQALAAPVIRRSPGVPQRHGLGEANPGRAAVRVCPRPG
jgi:hypothetical protein